MNKSGAFTRITRTNSLVIIVVIALVLVVLEITTNIPSIQSPLERIELSAHDMAMRLRGVQKPGVPIAIVAIDDSALHYTGYQWPWPRAYLAQIVEALKKAGAKIVGFDIFLFEPDPDPRGDQALTNAFSNVPSVSVMQISRSNANGETLNLPLKSYQDALSALGTTVTVFDNDAIIRSVQAYDYSSYNNQYYYNWAFEVARLYLGVDEPSNPRLDQISFNGRTISLYNGKLLINFSGPPTTYGPYYSAHQVVLGDYPPDSFKDKIVLIGATSITLHDIYPTPFFTTDRMPGVEIVANTINSIITGNYYQQLPPIINIFIVLAAAGIAWLISRYRQPIVAIIFMVVCMLVYIVIWYFFYINLHWLFDLVSPEIMFLLGVIVPSTNQAITEELEKRRVRIMFSRFISPQMVDQLLKTQDINSLNKRAKVTILFSDIRGFTSISEKLTPEEVVRLLNPYLSVMTEVIHNNGGTIDKYEGDAIVAFFGEPIPLKDHAKCAARAAYQMHLALEKLRKKWVDEGVFTEKFDIGIGINTGEVFVGMLGSEHRINYTIIGDAVNLASRIQDQTKEYDWPILISAETFRAIADEFDADFLASRQLKGKTTPIGLFKFLGPKGIPKDQQVTPTHLK